jgi:K+:H+ antiporter
VSTDAVVVHVVAAIAVVTGLAYFVGQLFRRIGQPEVLGQLLIGIALGPSLAGRFAGGVVHSIFPAVIVSYLNVISQIALVLFLFAIGYELDLRILRRQRRAVAAVAVSAFAIPMALGAASVWAFGNWYRAAGEPRTESAASALYMGVAVSITAVPVLASIVAERGIAATIPGVTAMASAALIDATGWLTLAGVLVIASVSTAAHRPWALTAILLFGYVVVTLLFVRPLLRKWLRRRGAVVAGNVPVAVATALSSAWATAALGLHVIFGALLAGLIMPRRQDGAPDPDILGPVLEAGRLFIPVFFMLSGLSVNVGLLGVKDFALFGAVCLIAVTGKLGGGALAARIGGMGARDSAVVGVLLNTRGLTELIALNAGLQAGVIHQRLYTLLVLMALLTTASTGPLLTLAGSRGAALETVPTLESRLS